MRLHKHQIIIGLCAIFFFSCNIKSPTFQEKAETVVYVGDKIIDIKSNLFFSFGHFYIIDSFLVINEAAPKNPEAIHFLDINNFKHILSTGTIGRGPGEITRIGTNIIDHMNSTIWVNDYANHVRWKFPLDSILNNKNFRPSKTIELNPDFFLNEGAFIDDSTIIGNAVIPLSPSEAEMRTAILDFNNNNITKYGYENLNLTGRNTYGYFALSLNEGVYVTCYINEDLMILCDLNGKLISQIKGSDINKSNSRKNYFMGVDFYKKYIIASYLGAERFVQNSNKAKNYMAPSRFLIFNTEGEYLKTLETANEFSNFIIDEQNQRIIIYFDDREHLLGYIDLSEILS
ncbi:hypothetical protein [Natronoflexus pectinivorans]|uniref:TolB-like protein n=1 Tax=Natronoflexus pectinivorans TaxID=682526 RepID=A0A4R2GGF6_9BACT|nr:hypothetical protein [Natronoflexus pectinivorans]TCO07335.1 hypothetical protein EV194_109154 [Natronoflexus pectinivorans]